jgi:hypothetical protein
MCESVVGWLASGGPMIGFKFGEPLSCASALLPALRVVADDRSDTVRLLPTGLGEERHRKRDGQRMPIPVDRRNLEKSIAVGGVPGRHHPAIPSSVPLAQPLRDNQIKRQSDGLGRTPTEEVRRRRVPEHNEPVWVRDDNCVLEIADELRETIRRQEVGLLLEQLRETRDSPPASSDVVGASLMTGA